jgi:hypothetical protein
MGGLPFSLPFATSRNGRKAASGNPLNHESIKAPIIESVEERYI